ncbi:MAG: non-ribosomal peptide synthetase, partial [Pseudomarimonas sp.]
MKTYHPTPLQLEILLLQDQYPDKPIHNIGGYTKFCGELDWAALERAHLKVCATYDAWRLRLVSSEDGVRLQFSEDEPNSVFVDLANHPNGSERLALDFIASVMERPFDMRGSLFRAGIIRVAQDEAWFFVVAHHVIMDGHSFVLWHRVVARSYDEAVNSILFVEPTRRVSFESLLLENEGRPTGDTSERDRTYWATRFQRLPHRVFRRRTDVPHEAQPSRRITRCLESATFDAIRSYCDEHKLGIQSFFIGVLHAYVARISGQTTSVIGVPSHNRTNAATKTVVGSLASLTPLLVQIDSGSSFLRLCERIGRDLRQDYRHRKYPLSSIRRDLGLHGPEMPLFEVQFSYQLLNYAVEIKDLKVATTSLGANFVQTPICFTLCEFGEGHEIEVQFDYNLAYMDDEEASLTLERLLGIIQWAVRDPARPLCEVPILCAADERKLGGWNSGSLAWDLVCVHERFEFQVSRHPDMPALVQHGVVTTYRELDFRANDLANVLIERGVLPGDLVGVLTSRSPELVVCMLGALKAGAAFVPLDPQHPADRLCQVVRDSNLRCVVGDLPSWESIHRVPLVDSRAAVGSTLRPDVSVPTDALAYVIFTSGSTGQPKGVCVTHAQFMQALTSINGVLDIGYGDLFPCLASQAFDGSLLELWVPLTHGGCSEVLERTLVADVPALLEATSQATVLWTVTSLMAPWLEYVVERGVRAVLPRLRQVIVGGEAVPKSLLEALVAALPGVRVIEIYGPTETVIFTTYQVADAGRPPVEHCIGKLLPNARAQVLDPHGGRLPIGVTGELHLGGPSVARGYLNRPELTAARFVSDPYADDAGARMYRTGDLVRWLPGG